MKDETIIELTEEVIDEKQTGLDQPRADGEGSDADDDVIELTEVVLDPVDDAPVQQQADTPGDYPNASGLADEPAPIDFTQAPQERLEAALARVIERMYADQIDDLLKGLIKKIVTNEMDRIKLRLLDQVDADPEDESRQ